MPRVLKMTRDAVNRRHKYRLFHAKTDYEFDRITRDEYLRLYVASSSLCLSEMGMIIFGSESEIAIALIEYRGRQAIAKQVS